MTVPTASLADMCELIVDCPHSTPEWTAEGFLVIRNQNIRDGRLDLSDRSYTNRVDFEHRIRRAKPRGGDIIFTREAPMGEVCIVPDGLECCVGQRQVLLRPRGDIEGRYLFYALRSPFVRHQIFWNEGTGSTVSNVRIPILKALRIPRLGTAEAEVARVLGGLDDKIELNRRMNETLEAMAQAIFRDWFVDFGPVRRKMAGATDPVAIMGGLTSDPARAAELAALFPEALDEQGLPLGWAERPLDEITFPIRRGITPKYVDEGGALVINQKCIRDGRVSVAPARRHNQALRSIKGRELEVGDVLVNSTGVGTLGRLAQIWEVEEPTVADSHVTVVRADPAWVSPLFLGVAMRPREPEIVALGEGSTGQTELSRALLGRMGFIVPDRAVITAFDDLCGPVVEKGRANTREQRTLAETRDYLLPRLMSGQVRVGDIVLEAAQ